MKYFNIYVKLFSFVLIYSFMACNIASEEINSSNAEDKSSSQIDTRKKKCSNMDSYDYGYAVAKDQDGLLADCNYLYDAAITQKNISSKSCFCAGVSAYRSEK